MPNQTGDDLRREEQEQLLVALSEAPQSQQPMYLRRLGDLGDLDALEEAMLYLASTSQPVVDAAMDAVGRIQRRAAEAQALAPTPLPPPPYVPPGASTTTTTRVTYTVSRSAPPPPPPPPPRKPAGRETPSPTQGELRAERNRRRDTRKAEEQATRAAAKPARQKATPVETPPPPPPLSSAPAPAPGDTALFSHLERDTVRGVGQPAMPVSAPLPPVAPPASGAPPLPAVAALPPRFEDRNRPKTSQDGMS